MPLTEAQIMRFLAIAGLVAGLLVSAYILFNSGIVGGATPMTGTVEPLDSAAAPGPATTATTNAGVPGTPTTGNPAETTPAETTPTGTNASTTRSGNTYVIQSGDSFYTIARKYNTSIAQIQQLNPDLDPSNLTTGATVNVP